MIQRSYTDISENIPCDIAAGTGKNLRSPLPPPAEEKTL